MGYDAAEDTYATSCDEFSDSETELTTVEQLLRGYEPPLLVLDGSDHALFAQIDVLIASIRESKLLQHIRISSSFLQGLMDIQEGNEEEGDEGDDATATSRTNLAQAGEFLDAIASLAPICLESLTCHLHPRLPRHELVQCPGLLQCARCIPKLTLNNFVLTPELVAAVGANRNLVEFRAYFDATNHFSHRQERRQRRRSSKQANGSNQTCTNRTSATTSASTTLDPLFLALASSPKLKTLDVYDKHDERPEQARRVSPAALTRLCQNGTLKELKLWHLDTPLVVAVAQALSGSSPLTTLTIGSSFLTHEAYVALADMLSSSLSNDDTAKTKGCPLKHLYLADIASCESCIAIANALRNNETLQSLELTYDQGGEQLGAAFLELLRDHNTTLTHLKLFMSYSMDNDDSALEFGIGHAQKNTTKADDSHSQVSHSTDGDAVHQKDWETQVLSLLKQNKTGTR